MTIAARVKIKNVKILSDDGYVLKKTTFEFERRDGKWQTQTRKTYDRGNGVTILLYDIARRKVLLTRQFRFPAFASGHDNLLIETPAGLLDGASPHDRIRREVEEETGYHARNIRKIFEAFMSPGAVTEKLHFFVGEYGTQDRFSNGGGREDEGEDIEVLEANIDDALSWISDGKIQDAKTIMLLQYGALSIFKAERPDKVR